jgi:hypothetical protein
MMQRWSQEGAQDHTVESWDDAEKKREEIIKKLTEVKETLAQLQLNTTQQKEQAQPQQTFSGNDSSSRRRSRL